MPRPLLVLILVAVVLVGGVVILSTLDTERPLTRMEAEVTADAASR